MPHYRVTVITETIRDQEPLRATVLRDDSFCISSFSYQTPTSFDDYAMEYKRHKISRYDLVLFRDDLPRELIFDFSGMLNKLSQKNGDTWWGVLAYKYNEKDEEAWAKIGSRYYGTADGAQEFSKFLPQLHKKPANYERYTRSKRSGT